VTDQERRQQLFDRYQPQLALFGTDPPGLFDCPLCMRGFPRQATEGPEPALTLAHVIPDKLGGNLRTLACKDCNNGVGHSLESALVERFLAEDCMAGVIRLPGRVSGPFGNIGVEYTRSPDRRDWKFYAVPEQTNPANMSALHEFLVGLPGTAGDGVQFVLDHRYDHQPRRVAVALYQSAYLLLFSYFGYEFALHPHFAPLREQFADPENSTLRTTFPDLSGDSVPSLLRGAPYAVMFLREPAPAILAVLRLRPKKSGQERRLGVVLPGLEDPAFPALEGTRFRGGLIPYRPEVLARSMKFMQWSWQKTRTVCGQA
jgi:hypothetical protein